MFHRDYTHRHSYENVHRYMEGMKFGHLILRSIVKIVVTKCQILRLNCTKIDFGWCSAPDPAGSHLTY